MSCVFAEKEGGWEGGRERERVLMCVCVRDRVLICVCGRGVLMRVFVCVQDSADACVCVRDRVLMCVLVCLCMPVSVFMCFLEDVFQAQCSLWL